MSATHYAISWIYEELCITRIQRGFPLERWTAPFEVKDLGSLCQAMSDACEYVDLSRGGNVSFVYEDDLHTHELLELPNMSVKDLERLLERKVESSKPFEEKAAWCYHEARHEDDKEGVLLHLMPQHIVDSILRICQEYYLTPNRLVPLTEVMSEQVQSYKLEPESMVILAALFSHHTEFIIALGSGEVLLVRELPYCGRGEGEQRLVTDINRTLRYCKQKFGCLVDTVWLLGEHVDQVHANIDIDIETTLNYDPNSLDPVFWAVESANLTGQLSANFIPLLARKKLNRKLFYRAAMWVSAVILTSAITVFTSVEYAIAKQNSNNKEVLLENASIESEIVRIQHLADQAETSKRQLQLLQADEQNLPALFINHLGDLTPQGLVLTNAEVHHIDNAWRISLTGHSKKPLDEVADVLQEFESGLQSAPWNLQISQSWKSSWYDQLRSGAASGEIEVGFKIVGWMK